MTPSARAASDKPRGGALEGTGSRGDAGGGGGAAGPVAEGVAVLVSGSGTILESILTYPVPIALVLSDRPCRGLEVGRAAGRPTELVDRRAFGGFGKEFRRGAYTGAVTDALVRHGIALVVMAGFGTILDRPIHDAYPNRILNTHPSLLPAFPGWRAVADALAAGVTETGCTVHIATMELDSGPILAQRSVPVRVNDSVETLHERIKEVERRLYPETIVRFMTEHVGGISPDEGLVTAR